MVEKELPQEYLISSKLIDKKSIIQKIKENGGSLELIKKYPNIVIRENLILENFTSENDNTLEVVYTKDLTLQNPVGNGCLRIKELIPPRTYLLSVDYNILESEKEKINSQDSSISLFYYTYASDKKTGKLTSYIIYSDLSKPGGVLSLLHEIGHSQLREKGKEVDDARMDLEISIDEAVEKKRTKARKGERLIYVEDKKGKKIIVPVDEEEYLNYHMLNAEHERESWAFALKILRKMRREGFDLEPTLKNTKQLNHFIHHPKCLTLGSYEEDFISEQVGLDKIIGVYSRKTYKLIKEDIEEKKLKNNR